MVFRGRPEMATAVSGRFFVPYGATLATHQRVSGSDD